MIGIIAAMDEEMNAILKLVKEDRIEVHNGYDFHIGTMSGVDVMVVKCRVGKVNAAILTTLMLIKAKCDLIINVGCAGSTNKDVHVGDVVVAVQIAHHDIDVPGDKWERNYENTLLSFTCDGHCLDILKDLDYIHFGGICSGESFIYKKSQVDEILEHYPDCLCAEMEGSAIAQACANFSKPCIIIRSISDETLVNGDYFNFDFNLEKACNNAAEICKYLVERY